MEEPGGLQSTGHKESDTTERLHFHFLLCRRQVLCPLSYQGSPVCFRSSSKRLCLYGRVHGQDMLTVFVASGFPAAPSSSTCLP